MTETLRNQATSGFRWTAGAHGARQVVQLATLAALTRLLEPGDFGLMSMAVVFSGFAQLFQDLGIGSAIIQRRELSRALLSTLFWVTLACGAGLFVLVAATAPLVAGFYGEARITALLQVTAITFIAGAPGIVPKAKLRRDLRFDALARIEVAGIVVGAATAVISAALGAGPFALAAQALGYSAASSALLWLAARWTPELTFCWTELRSVTGYSASLTGFNICNHFTRNADYLILGKLAGAEALGYYTIAYQLMLYPLRHVSKVITRVAYPVYAKLQDEPIRLRQAFCRTSANIATITFPVMVGLAAAAEPLVMTVFGPQWRPAALLLVLLAPVGLAQSLITTFGAIYEVTGRAGLLFVWSIAVGVLGIAGFMIGVRWGAEGVAAAYLIVTALIAAPSMIVPFGLIGLPVPAYLRTLSRPALCAAVMGLVMVMTERAVGDELSPVAQLAALAAIGAATYAALTAALNRQRLRDLLEVVMPRAAVRPG